MAPLTSADGRHPIAAGGQSFGWIAYFSCEPVHKGVETALKQAVEGVPARRKSR
jgi:hypothetical protein